MKIVKEKNNLKRESIVNVNVGEEKQLDILSEPKIEDNNSEMNKEKKVIKVEIKKRQQNGLPEKEVTTMEEEEEDLLQKSKESLVMVTQQNSMILKDSKWIVLKPSYGQNHLLSSFPDYLMLYIFGFLDLKSLICVSMVCTEWRRLTNDKKLWKEFYQHYFINRKQLFSLPSSLSHDFTVDWKDRVKTKFILEKNWSNGEYVSNNLRAHTAWVTGIYFQQK